MLSSIRELLKSYRALAETEREKGNYFERLAVAFIKNDPGMVQEYENAWLFVEWATRLGLDGRDTGIDAVAKIRGEEGFCAIQCKFYREGYRIQKGDIDSFFTASGKTHFSRRLIIDTTDAPWSENAENALAGQTIPATRIGLDRLEESPINWSAFLSRNEVKLDAPKKVKPHQVEAIADVCKGLATADRGKLIMACGTGKTFTALKIAEVLAGKGKSVLYLVPSLALMSQTVRAWTIDANVPLRSYAVCSDVQVGKRRIGGNEDVAEVEAHDLDYPATTDARKLAAKASKQVPDRMTVVFATYQSIEAISKAQKKFGLSEFDLIVCDEAHRTTGATLAGEDESNFVKVHDQTFIASKKRLYMTATPRVFGDNIKVKAREVSAELCSMDDEALYGQTLFQRGFGWAVENKLLTDYKVLVLAVDEEMVSAGVQKRLADGTSELKLDDATKIIGCYKALTKSGLKAELLTDPHPMRRALAFCRDIKSSKLVRDEFEAVITEYLASDEGKEVFGEVPPLTCAVQHVDGTFNAKARTACLDWLKKEHDDNACRILSNARCLSEGVDVPALDAILFMHPRKSQIDVVQSVGRVMRRAPGKNMGYVILPIGVPPNKTPEEALNDNERYRVVWQILNALRSHDERLDATINKMDLGEDVSPQIEVIAVSNRLPNKRGATKSQSANIGQGGASNADDDDEGVSSIAQTEPEAPAMRDLFAFDEFAKAIMAKIVKKCGRRDYWEDWAADVAKIAQAHIARIKAIVSKVGTPERKAFDGFLAELRDDLNEGISEDDAIEMLAQHLITRPVFEALFEDYSFAANNPVSVAMGQVLEALHEQNLDKETDSLQGFYASVKRRAANIKTDPARQKIVVELYETFFKNAFPKMVDRLGIVYTPVEVVDFIIHSVDEVLRSEFGQSLGSKGVHIIDPFTGTGTFVTRLLQSGLIKPEELEWKYKHEIHANEIVLLAYYIAAINIEAAYHSLSCTGYTPFDGICLTDTFQLYEQKKDLISLYMPDNSTRRTRQKALDIRVIFGNPPYSAGQNSANDNAANQTYPKLDARIRETYAANSSATNKNALYDSYIRAIRWGSDRLGKSGVMAYVSNAGWIDGNAADGLRKCLAEEFASLYVFHLRGNQRTSGERSRQEGGKIFGSGSRSPIAISIFIKNPDAKEQGKIFFHDIGDYLNREDKLNLVRTFASIGGIAKAGGWQRLTPDQHNDWLGQRDDSFENYLLIGSKGRQSSKVLFRTYSSGVKTNRDAWCYNPSRQTVESSMRRMIDFYNSEVNRYIDHVKSGGKTGVEDFISLDTKKISWNRSLRKDLEKKKQHKISDRSLVVSLYRPYFREWLYFNRAMNNDVSLTPQIFPIEESGNLAFFVSGASARCFSVIMLNCVPSFDAVEKGQCFPLYLYDGVDRGGLALGGGRTDGITNAGLSHFQAAYPGTTIGKEDIFYYVYGLLHSEDYRTRFADNLSKELPRIPCVKGAANFWAFVEAGRRLGDLHVNYETVEPYPVTIKEGDLRLANIPDPEKFYRVEKMRFGGKRPKLDKTTVVYNSNITMTGVPLAAYDYVVNGKPALEWVMERQCVKTDKKSGIVNDANDYANETVGDPAYPLKLFQRVITVSLETMKIVNALPALDID